MRGKDDGIFTGKVSFEMESDGVEAFKVPSKMACELMGGLIGLCKKFGALILITAPSKIWEPNHWVRHEVPCCIFWLHFPMKSMHFQQKK